jgi:hypothetical protein
VPLGMLPVRTSLSAGLAMSLMFAAASACGQQVLIADPPDHNSESGFGESIASVGDIDGDGIEDFMVGASAASPDELVSQSGAAYIFSGRNGSLLRTLVSPNPEFLGYFGAWVGGIADLNGDGVGDILIGAPNEGRAYVFSGADGSLLLTLVSGDPEHSVFFGAPIVALPDIDGDGISDIAVGAPGEDQAHGRAYLYSGATGALLHTLASPNPPAGTTGYFGTLISAVEDADGDGFGDVLVATYQEVPPRAYLFSGATGLLIRSVDFGDDGWVVGVPDADGDGRGDYAVSLPRDPTPGCPSCQGAVYVYSGATGALLHRIVSPQQGFLFGYGQVCGSHDLNDDRRGDIIVGDPFGHLPGQPMGTGVVYVFSGATGALIRTVSGQHVAQNVYFGSRVGVVNNSIPGAHPNLLVFAAGCPSHCPPDTGGRVYDFISCAADFDYSGIVNSQDFFDFLARFFDGRADFNQDGVTNTQDFFDFLAAFFAGC